MSAWLAIGLLVAGCGGETTTGPPGNRAPVASGGADRFVDPGASVTLDATASTDPDGDSLAFTWSLSPPGGSAATLSATSGPSTTFVTDLLGAYRVDLTVSDGSVSSSDDVVVSACYSDAHLVVLGSSTAAGVGPSDPDNAWVRRYRTRIRAFEPSATVTNLAVGGYSTYEIMPSDFVPPSGRPRSDPDANITRALSLEPDVVVINLPSNDAGAGYPVADQISNYDVIVAAASSQSVPVWIATTQPRSNLGADGRANLREMRDSTFSHFGRFAIDFWTTLARADGTVDPRYDSGDGAHLNDEGHRILFERVSAKAIFCGTG